MSRSYPATLAPALLDRRLAAALPTLLVLGAVVLPAFVASDNLHAVVESTSYDRLVLGLRTLRPSGGIPRWDPHFPLGTAVVMAVPWGVGLDPVGFSRGLSFMAALVAALGVFALLRRAAGPLAGAAGAAAIWLVPSFTRGAIVTGEEAIYTALVVFAALALARGHGAQRPLPWMFASLLAINGTVLFRLDAMTLVPLFALLGLAAFGPRRGAIHGALCFLTTALHIAVSAWVTGDPLGFARVASMNIRRNASGFDALGPAVLPANLAAELGGWPVLVAALLGAVVLLRRPRERAAGRVLGILLVGVLLIDLVLTMAGAMEARTMRYLVPALVLCVVGVAALVADLLTRSRWVGAAVGLGLAALLLGQVLEIRGQAARERLPEGLVDAARMLGGAAGSGRVLVGEQHPTVIVESGLPWAQLGVMPPGAPGDGGQSALRDKMEGARWLLQVAGNPPLRAEAMGELGLEQRLATPCCVVYERVGRPPGR